MVLCSRSARCFAAARTSSSIASVVRITGPKVVWVRIIHHASDERAAKTNEMGGGRFLMPRRLKLGGTSSCCLTTDTAKPLGDEGKD